MINSMIENGASNIADCAIEINDSLSEGDESKAVEILEGMAKEAVELIKDQIHFNNASQFNSIVEKL